MGWGVDVVVGVVYATRQVAVVIVSNGSHARLPGNPGESRRGGPATKIPATTLDSPNEHSST